MEEHEVLAWLTLAAIVLGPIFAVVVTRFMDNRREIKDRKMSIFRDLMETRGVRLNPKHVAALNLVEVEFYHSRKVRDAFKSYIEHLSAPMPVAEEQERFIDERTDRFMDLLFNIGAELGLKYDKRELERKSYTPVAWGNNEDIQVGNARLLNELLSGRRPLPVTNHLPHNPFPEPPILED